MSYDIFTPINLHQNQIEEFAFENLAVAPASPVNGQVYFDTVLGYARTWDGAVWTAMSPAGASYATNIGDGLALAYTVTHNLGTRDVVVSVFNNTTFNESLAVVQHTTVNTLTITFTLPPLLNQYRVVVQA